MTDLVQRVGMMRPHEGPLKSLLQPSFIAYVMTPVFSAPNWLKSERIFSTCASPCHFHKRSETMFTVPPRKGKLKLPHRPHVGHRFEGTYVIQMHERKTCTGKSNPAKKSQSPHSPFYSSFFS